MCASDHTSHSGVEMIYCFDIDGTVCSLVESSNYELATPFPEAVKEINKLHTQGHEIIFMTARGSVSGIDWTETTERQLREWGLKYHKLIMNQKPNADFYIDDKGVSVNDWMKSFTRKRGLVAGAFDVIHPGYVEMFKQSKTACNYLIVALHDDDVS